MSRPLVTPFKPTLRERALDYAAEQEAVTHRSKELKMSKRKTPQGDSVATFPDTARLLDGVEELRDELTDLYDAAAEMQERSVRMERDGKPDTNRFSVLREG